MARARGSKLWQIGQDAEIFVRPLRKERFRQIANEAIEFIQQSVLADEGMESLVDSGDYGTRRGDARL